MKQKKSVKLDAIQKRKEIKKRTFQQFTEVFQEKDPFIPPLKILKVNPIKEQP